MNCRGPNRDSLTKHEIELCLDKRDTWPPLTFDLWQQSRGQETIAEKCDPSYKQVWEPFWIFGWSLLGSDEWCDGSVNMCHCNCTDQHLLIQRRTQSKDIVGWIRCVSGSGDIKMLTSTDLRKQTSRDFFTQGLLEVHSQCCLLLRQKTDLVPDAWKCLLRKAAPTVLLLWLIKKMLHFIIVPSMNIFQLWIKS